MSVGKISPLGLVAKAYGICVLHAVFSLSRMVRTRCCQSPIRDAFALGCSGTPWIRTSRSSFARKPSSAANNDIVRWHSRIAGTMVVSCVVGSPRSTRPRGPRSAAVLGTCPLPIILAMKLPAPLPLSSARVSMIHTHHNTAGKGSAPCTSRLTWAMRSKFAKYVGHNGSAAAIYLHISSKEGRSMSSTYLIEE